MIYLDHHAATPMSAAVRQAMQDAVEHGWANASSTHGAGRASRRLLEEARDVIAETIGARPADVVLTGGGTEACNLGIGGVVRDRRRVVTTGVEHPAVAATVERLRAEGRDVVVLDVPAGVPPSPEVLSEAVDSQTAVAMQWVNHETGTTFPVEAYAAICAERGAPLFLDATQALGKLPIDVSALGASAVALAAHKVGGPAGAGACWIARGLDVDPILGGGAQERGRRPGTPDTVNMVGFAAACAEVPTRISDQPRIEALRDRIENVLVDLGARPNAGAPRVATVTNLAFEGWKGSVLVAALDVEGVCVSTGAACSSGLQTPSAVIAAMYPDAQWRAGSAVRISLGMQTTEAEIEAASAVFAHVIERSHAQNLKQI